MRRLRLRQTSTEGMVKSELQLTASIRRGIVADDSRSTYAHNVKIVVQSGVAILKGPMRRAEEKAAIEAIAAAAVGQDHFVDQLEIAKCRRTCARDVLGRWPHCRPIFTGLSCNQR